MQNTKKILWDISPALQVGMPVWPGDTPFQSNTSCEIESGCPVKVSNITLSTHTGAHCDAPSHFTIDAPSIDQVDLSTYIGECRVIHALGVKVILPEHIQPFLTTTPPRVLMRTYTTSPTNWDPHFSSISVEAIHLLASHNVKLIGLDTPSLDHQKSKTLDAHHAVQKHNMAILECIVLDEVAAGDYELIALPLKLTGLDASPVRAILRSL